MTGSTRQYVSKTPYVVYQPKNTCPTVTDAVLRYIAWNLNGPIYGILSRPTIDQLKTFTCDDLNTIKSNIDSIYGKTFEQSMPYLSKINDILAKYNF